MLKKDSISSKMMKSIRKILEINIALFRSLDLLCLQSKLNLNIKFNIKQLSDILKSKTQTIVRNENVDIAEYMSMNSCLYTIKLTRVVEARSLVMFIYLDID